MVDIPGFGNLGNLGNLGQNGQKMGVEKFTGSLADSLSKDLGMQFQLTQNTGEAVARLNPNQAVNLDKVLKELLPQEKEKLFGRVDYQVRGNDLVVSVPKNMGTMEIASASLGIVGNTDRPRALKEGMESGNVDKVRSDAGLPSQPHRFDNVQSAPQQGGQQQSGGSGEKADMLNSRLSPALKFSADADGKLSAPISATQKANLQKVFGALNESEDKAVKGNLDFTISTAGGQSRLVIKNGGSLSTDDIGNFLGDRNGSSNALLAAQNGDVAATKAIVKGTGNQPVQEESLGRPRSDAGDASKPIDEAKLAAAGYKIPERSAEAPARHGLDGVVAKAPEVDKGRTA